LHTGCELCESAGGHVVWSDDRLRVLRIADVAFPGFCRVVWNAHVAELSDLSDADRAHVLDVVVSVERCLREHLKPTKINLASLGNVVQHLHWHVVARFDWDSRFPQPIWAAAVREAPSERLAAICGTLPALETNLRTALESRFPSEAQP
jgi:diadenosine tetraphosphate (Ap4A) HIT family hydrolase